jgi:hypothetical protein
MISKYLKPILFVVFIVACCVQAIAQPRNAELSCGENGQGLFSGSYYETVLHLIRPPDWEHLIALSFSEPLETRYILRMRHGNKFELLRGTPEQSIYEILEAADRACKLPLQPSEALSLVHIKWQRVSLSESAFDKFHRDFSAAVEKHAAYIQEQFGDYLKGKPIAVYLHTDGFTFDYDDLVERLQVESTDSVDERGKGDPLNGWAHAVLKFADESLPK